VEAIRKSGVEFIPHKGWVEALVSLFPIVESLGIVLPAGATTDDGAIVEKFCEAFGVCNNEIIWDEAGETCLVPFKIVPHLICAAKFPPVIERQLITWFNSHISERYLASLYSMTCAGASKAGHENAVNSGAYLAKSSESVG
jgi:hypothetical protein